MIRIFQHYISVKSIVLLVLEAILICAGLLAAEFLRRQIDTRTVLQALPILVLQVLVVLIAVQISLYYNDLYGSALTVSWPLRIIGVGQAIGVACVILGLLYLFIPAVSVHRDVLLPALLLIGLGLCSVRFAIDVTWPLTVSGHNYLILGTGPAAASVGRELEKRKDLHVNLNGFIRFPGDPATPDCGGPVLGQVEDLYSLAMDRRIRTVVVALEDRRGRLPMDQLVRLRVNGTEIQDAASTLSALQGRVSLETLHPSWFVFSDGFRRSRWVLGTKTVSDILLALVALVISAPVMLLVALIVRLDSPGPVLYRQKRVGRKGRDFDLLKFRSMSVDAERNGAAWATVNDPRVTRAGHWLRKFRLDELPQLINVLRAEMSFVGPRPERPEFVELLRRQIPYYDERHSLRPGITGWAQVSYTYSSSIDDTRRKLEYDLFYLKNMSLWFDIVIVIDTVRTVLTGQGAR
jgi:sugar transferase (PEP-CTERM system associated)